MASTSSNTGNDIEIFFSETNRISKTLPRENNEIGKSTVTNILRPYQYDNAQWMIARERNPGGPLNLKDFEITLPRGGLLADEMGLGKTVELLACILGNQKDGGKIDSNCLASPSKSPSLKRKHPEKSWIPSFLTKKPRLSSAMQNIDLKSEIRRLLQEYYNHFKYTTLSKNVNLLNDKCRNAIERCFKIILLYRLFDRLQHQNTKQQIWGYLITEFDVNQADTVGYSILLQETGDYEDTALNTGNLSKDEAINILNHVNLFLNDKLMKRIHNEFDRRMRVSMFIFTDNCVPFMEKNDVQCNCGADKMKGEKIKCTKCGLLQHHSCVGLSSDTVQIAEYICPKCWVHEPPVESGATLIVVPSTLLKQWENEIKKHAADANLRTYSYEGVNKNYLLPPKLASYDIVFTTFTVLSSELPYAYSRNHNLRNPKRYHSFLTPLTRIEWWRVCVDEAQMVETANKVSEMAMQLKFVNIWAVTGTPIGKSLDDLYGLVTYLRMEPFAKIPKVWRELLRGDQSSLHTLFAHIMQRRTKIEVNDQLQLPPLTTEITWLSFTPAEGFFYNSTYEALREKFLEKLAKIPNPNCALKKSNRTLVSGVMHFLLSLRQACVHPQIVKSKNLFNLHNNETMLQLLEKMIKKTKIDCTDTLRLYVMFVNGAASVNLSNRQYANAVSLYRSVMAKMKFYHDLTHDNFQVIHVMYNLLEAASNDPTIVLTDEEKEFGQRIQELESKFLTKTRKLVCSMKEQLSKATADIMKALGSTVLKEFSSWKYFLAVVDFENLKVSVKNALKQANIKMTPELESKFNSRAKLSESINFWLDNVENKRNLCFQFMERICDEEQLETIWKTADSCHLRKTDPKRTCQICRMEDVMLAYEGLITNTSETNKTMNRQGNANPIDWKTTPYECILKLLLNYGRVAFGTDEQAKNQLKALGLLTKEFKCIRAVWSRQCDYLHAYDEIKMAKSAFDATVERTSINMETSLAKFKLHEYHDQSCSAYVNIQKKYGSLQYLINLEKRYANNEVDDESCPVCVNAVDDRRAVLTCGHFMCYECIQMLIKHNSNNKIHCPVCRALIPCESVTYIYGGGATNVEMMGIVGNYSMKILAITAKVLDLVKADANVKILVFSTWDTVLDVVEKAFNENNVNFERIKSGPGGISSLESFKTQNKNALLIPLRLGSKGLNIVEASHVIFTEPGLQLSDEDQAIGRIYRLGQKKKMTVHKFVVKGTVEEHIHRMHQEYQKEGAMELTFTHLRNLFEPIIIENPTQNE